MNRERNIILLSSLFISSLVIANLLGSKIVSLFGIETSIGIFVFPVTFFVTDLISELYGSKVATNTVAIGLMIQVYVLIAVWLGGLLPAIPERDLTQAYRQMFALAPRMIIASIIAYTCSQFLDVRIFHALKTNTKGRHLWLRNNVSTMTSQLIDSFIFIFIFLGGVLPAWKLVHTALFLYFLKVIMALCDTPFIYLGKYCLEERPVNIDENISRSDGASQSKS